MFGKEKPEKWYEIAIIDDYGKIITCYARSLLEIKAIKKAWPVIGVKNAETGERIYA